MNELKISISDKNKEMKRITNCTKLYTMKNLNLLLLVLLIILNHNYAKAQKSKENKQLIIEGTITSNDVILKNKTVSLFLADKIVGTATSNEYGSFKINLDFGKTYYLVIGGDEYDTKWIKICTRIPLKHRKVEHTVQCYINVKPKQEYTIVETYAEN